MKAWVRDRYGGPEVLRFEDVPEPVVGAGDVLVRIRAASVNHADVDYLSGTPALTRMAVGLRGPKLRGVGIDAAGEVEAVGAGVTRLRPGDRVYANLTEHRHGAFAELACAPERAWHAMPEGLSFEQASTVPESAVLALQGLADRGGVKPGEAVLINGASGCTGPFAVQLAKAAGAHVTGACRTSKMDMVRALGVDDVIDYTAVDYTRSGRRWDRILDAAGTRSVFEVRRALTPNGIYRSFGSTSSARILHTGLVGPLLSLGRGRSMGLMFRWKPNDPAAMATLGAMLQAGTLVPVIDRSYPLDGLPDALRRMIAGEARGKLVLTM
jgi:NADPH:quinone reductase-like Zn-dependent oxidoreductase